MGRRTAGRTIGPAVAKSNPRTETQAGMFRDARPPRCASAAVRGRAPPTVRCYSAGVTLATNVSAGSVGVRSASSARTS